MTSRHRDRLIRIDRTITEQDEYGEPVSTGAVSFSEWARVFYGRGSERREAAAETSEMVITFSVLSNANTRTISAKDRILYDGTIWNVGGVAQVARTEIEITAKGVRA